MTDVVVAWSRSVLARNPQDAGVDRLHSAAFHGLVEGLAIRHVDHGSATVEAWQGLELREGRFFAQEPT